MAVGCGDAVPVGEGDSVGVGAGVSGGGASVSLINETPGLVAKGSVKTVGSGVVAAVNMPQGRYLAANKSPRASIRITRTPATIGMAPSL